MSLINLDLKLAISKWKRWKRTNTLFDPDATPDYGIVSIWGHHLAYIDKISKKPIWANYFVGGSFARATSNSRLRALGCLEQAKKLQGAPFKPRDHWLTGTQMEFDFPYEVFKPTPVPAQLSAEDQARLDQLAEIIPRVTSFRFTDEIFERQEVPNAVYPMMRGITTTAPLRGTTGLLRDRTEGMHPVNIPEYRRTIPEPRVVTDADAQRMLQGIVNDVRENLRHNTTFNTEADRQFLTQQIQETFNQALPLGTQQRYQVRVVPGNTPDTLQVDLDIQPHWQLTREMSEEERPFYDF